MSAWDYIPHRRLINKSLRKAADELRVKIDAYQIEYDRRIEECRIELEQEENERNCKLEEFRSSLNQELQNDQELLNDISEDVTRYVDKYLYGQYIDKFLEVKNSLYRVLQENQDYLSAQMNNIGEEIEIFEQRKQALVSFTDIHDIVELMQLSGYEMSSESITDASVLLKNINTILSTLEKEKVAEGFSLRRLKNIVQQRADYLATIQYIDWVIQQKIQFSKQLSSKRNNIRNVMSQLGAEIARLVDAKKTLNRDLAILAEQVRMNWARPITYLNAEIDYSYKRRTKKIQDKNEKIQEIKNKKKERQNIGSELHEMASSHAHDQFRWDRLKRDGEDLSSDIDNLSSDIDSLSSSIKHTEATIQEAKNKRKAWFSRKNTLCAIIKRYTGFFDYGRKISARDEQKVIDSRLAEIADIRAEGKKSAELKCTEERSQIDANHQRVNNDLAVNEAAARDRLINAKTALKKAEQLVLQRNAGLKKAQQQDNRFLLIRLFGGDTEEVLSTRSQLKVAEQNLKKSKEDVDECEREIERIHASLEAEEKDYKQKVRFCTPHYLRPTAEETLEEEKLMLRKQNMENSGLQEA